MNKIIRLILTSLLLVGGSALADITVESRNGVTAPHSEGRPIARYLSENTLKFSHSDLDVTLIGNVYGTQNWTKRVSQEDGMLKTDAVRFEYGAEIEYHLTDGWSIYTRHTMPVDRHDRSVGDGWHDTSFRWDSGIIYTHTWK